MRNVKLVYAAYLVTILLGIVYVTVGGLMGRWPPRAADSCGTTA